MDATLSTPTRAPRVIRGEVACLNCGRTLAAALKRLTDGAIRLGPCADGTLEVEVFDGRRLRCTRCGGKAFLEFDEGVAA